MKLIAVTTIICCFSSFAIATDATCLSQKYDAYVDTSIIWYQDLAKITSSEYPELTEVSNWFLEGRKHHFELNREAVHHYLEKDPSKIAIDRPVERWLSLEQRDIKVLSARNDKLGELAKITYRDRQSVPHEKNYELRSALADLLSHPTKIQSALERYNNAIKKVEKIICKQ